MLMTDAIFDKVEMKKAKRYPSSKAKIQERRTRSSWARGYPPREPREGVQGVQGSPPPGRHLALREEDFSAKRGNFCGFPFTIFEALAVLASLAF